jgi:hypothetical protein
MGIYAASIYLRSRNLKQDMSTLEDLDKPTSVPLQKQGVAKPASPPQTVTKSSTKN